MLRRTPILTLKRRTEAVLFGFMLVVAVLVARLVWIQGIESPRYRALARQMHQREILLPARRGLILARDGQPLAANVPAFDLTANPRVVADKRATAEALQQIVGGSAEEYYQRLSRTTGYFCWLRRALDDALAAQVRRRLAEPVMAGVELRRSTRRRYPCGSLAAQVTGDVDIDNVGRDGLEFIHNRVLAGVDGLLRAEVDAAGRVIPDTERQEREPVDGQDLQITLDPTVQQFAEAELLRVAEQYQPEAAIAVVMDVHTREVLALANWPTFDPDVREKVPIENRRVRAVTDPYEPGSAFKVFTAAAALEEGIDTHVYCSGSKPVGHHVIHCAHGKAHGACDLRRIVSLSCNIAAGTLAERLGAVRLWKHLKAFGLVDKTGIELGGEAIGWLAKPENWRTINTVNIGFGQGIAVNAIQLCNLFATVADDGMWRQPRVLLRAGNQEVAAQAPPHQAMSPANAALLRDCMEATCTEGTGKSAKIAHYRVGGKTGTAQIAAHGIYVPGAYVASFGGFFPAHRPHLVILVSVRRPKGAQYGGVVAAPAFREIARQCAAYLQIPPDAPGDERDGRDPGSFYRWQAHRGGSGGDSAD
ncbi:MAG: penicillin-binding protein 2 [Armatimonadetes bacterium]|nr:penicillin-binding protein 2 [Armatimonadota bacterium]